MAYSPLGRARCCDKRGSGGDRQRRGVTPAQVALAWVLRQPEVIAIPKASRLEHVRENRAALDLVLTAEDLAELDTAAPAAPPLDAAGDDLAEGLGQMSGTLPLVPGPGFRRVTEEEVESSALLPSFPRRERHLSTPLPSFRRKPESEGPHALQPAVPQTADLVGLRVCPETSSWVAKFSEHQAD